MTALVPHIFNGLTLGLLFALIALGFTLIVGVMEVINLAHGSLFAIGAYFGLRAPTETGDGTGAKSASSTKAGGTAAGRRGRHPGPFGEPGRYNPAGHCVGGMMLRWAGWSWRFRPDDFEVLSREGPVSGASLADWPFSYAQLEPFYEQLADRA